MSNTIILKKSGVLGKAPLTSNLQLGELAINYKDGYLFYRDNESSPAVHKINADDADTVDGFHLNQDVRTTASPSFAGLTVDTNTLYVDSANNRVGIRTTNAYAPLTLANVNGGSWNDGLIIDDPTGWAATIYKRSNQPKMFTGLRNGSDDFIWMSDGYSNSGTTITAPRTDAVLMSRPSTDDLQIYLETHFGQNVGIGTTSPSATLDVNGAGNFSGGTVVSGVDTKTNVGVSIGKGAYLVSNDGDYLRNIIGHATNGNIEIGQATVLMGDIILKPGSSGAIAFYGSGSEDARFDSNGRLGIGTTSPSNKLEVYTTSASENVFSVNNGTQRLQLGVNNSQGSFIFEQNSYALRFGTANTERMRIDSSGNVGIGTTSPSQELHVKGEVRAEDGGSSAYVDLKASQLYATGAYDVIVGSNNPLHFRTNTTRRMTIDGSGNVGIGTTSPARKLHVSTGNTDVAARFENTTSNGNVIEVKTSGDNKTLNIQTDHIYSNMALHLGSDSYNTYIRGSNVGIGTTSPSYKLDVNGSTRISGNITTDNETRRLQEISVLPGGYVEGSPINFRFDESQTAYAGESSGIGGTITATSGTTIPEASLKRLFTFTENYINLETYKDASNNIVIELSNISLSNSANTSWKPYVFFHSGASNVTSMTIEVKNGSGTWETVEDAIDVPDFYIHDGFHIVSAGVLKGFRLTLTGITGNSYLRMIGVIGKTVAPYAWNVLKSGSNMYGNLDFGDDYKARFGDSDDLQIYHDGSNSYIEDSSGTGSLIVNTNAFLLKSANDSEYMITAYEDGAVNLMHNNITRLSTTSTGVSITGTTTIDNVLVLNRASGSYGAGLRFHEAGTKTWQLKDDQDGGNNNSLILENSSDTPIVTFEQNGNVGIGTTSPSAKLHVNHGSDAGTYARFSRGTTNIDFDLGAAAAEITSTIKEFRVGTSDAQSFHLVSNDNNRLTIDSSGNATFTHNLTVSGDLTVNGTTSTINSTTVQVDDKNIELGTVATPTDTTADGGGITLKGATDKTINWVNSTDAWTFSERISIPAGSAASPSLTFAGDEDTGIYRSAADRINFSAGGTSRAYVDANGISSTGNVYASSQFRNFSNVWRATTGTTGNGFEFTSPDATALTISSTGDTVASGSVTATSLIKSGGSSSEFLKADGSVDSSSYSTISHNHTLDSLSNTTITSNTSGEILKWNGSAWINNTLAEAGIAAAGDENIIDGATSIWNADGDGDVFDYNDSNPTHNTKYVGAVINIRGDGATDSSLVRAGIFTSDHVSTVNGYYVGSLLGTANSTTTQVINNSGEWTGAVISSAKLDADTAHLSGTQTFSGAKTFSVNPKISHTGNIAFAMDKSDATTTTNLVSYVSFQAGGSEVGWFGFGSNGSSDLTLRNTNGKVVLNGSSGSDLGTVVSGTWNGGVIASAYLDSDTAHLSGTQTFSGAKTFSSGLNISVSTSNTQLKLKRTGTATGEFNIYTNNDTLFFNNVGQSSFPMVIDEDGNVGIGDTTPSYKLDVNGTFRSTGIANLDSGAIVTSGGISINSGDLTVSSGDVVITDGVLQGPARFIIDPSPYESPYTSPLNNSPQSTGEIIIRGDLEVEGHLAATTKSFLVDNPRTGGKLQYGVVESDEHGVYVRGKTDQNMVELPEEWEWLVDEDSVTVQLTSIGQMQNLFVIEQNNKYITVGGLAHNGQYNYVIYGTRKDVDPLEKHL